LQDGHESQGYKESSYQDELQFHGRHLPERAKKTRISVPSSKNFRNFKGNRLTNRRYNGNKKNSKLRG
jgi:hypothetical protein